MSEQIQSNANTKRTFWAVALFYMLIAFEFFYMASPFAFYFYSVYGPALNFIDENPALSWLVGVFLPHYAQTSSDLLKPAHLDRPYAGYTGLLGLLYRCKSGLLSQACQKGSCDWWSLQLYSTPTIRLPYCL